MATAAGGAMSLGALSPTVGVADSSVSPPQDVAPLRVLILGGTGFIGPHQVRCAMSRGHTVTLFNRGRTNPGLFPEAEKLRGDRDGDLEALKGREWDVVLDNSGYLPRLVRDSAQLLKDSVGRYLFVSSISVYDTTLTPGQDVDEAPILTMDDPTLEPENLGQYYGPLKALCEEEVRQAFGDRAINVRPGLITGPGDPTDRIRHWIARMERGGEILVPGKPTDPVQYIDARDLTAWSVRMLEQGDSGTFNATGPAAPLSMAGLVYGIRSTFTGDSFLTWVDEEFLAEREVRGGAYMPWLPSAGPMAAFNYINISRSLGTGLTFLPLATTAFDMLDEYRASTEREGPQGFGRRGGVSWEREAELLEEWHEAVGLHLS
jgi:2'-hydroxyisoflavone reductase